MAGLDGARIRRGTFTGGARGREGEDEKLRGSGEGSAAGRAREKMCFLVSQEELTQISTSWVG